MKPGNLLLGTVAFMAIAALLTDVIYTSRFEGRFKKLEKERIELSNKLATAQIVSENLGHVRDLVFRNMDFKSQNDRDSQESILFEFLTECVNDLKMRLISVRPLTPDSKGRVTTYGYDIQLEGDFFSLGELCAKLENSQRVMAITTLEVSLLDAKDARQNSKNKQSPSSMGSRAVRIKMHLDSFRVKKA